MLLTKCLGLHTLCVALCYWSLSVWANNGCRRYHQHHGVNIVYEDRSRIDERQGVKFCNIFERMLCEN